MKTEKVSKFCFLEVFRYLEHEPFPSVWIVKYIYFFVHKAVHMFSESFHRILKVKQGHEPSVIKDEELLLVLFKLEFPNSACFGYP